MKPIFTDEILPDCQVDSSGQKNSHDLLFTRLTEFLKRVIALQQQDKQVENKDISDYITSSTQVGLIIKKFETYKASHPQKFSDPNNIDLFSVYIHTTGSGLAIGALLKFSIAILSCIGIMILDLITDMLKDFSGKLDQKVEICFLLLLILIVFIIRNLASTQYDWISAKWRANTRTTLQYLVFSKLLRAQALTGKKKKETNEEDKKNSKSKETSPSDEESAPDVNNIMTVDIDKQLSVFWAVTESISSITSIVVILLLLYHKIGSAIYYGLFVLAGAFVFNILITCALLVKKQTNIGEQNELMYLFFFGFSCQKYFNKAQLKVKDKRVALSKDVIEGMKSIKYLGWEKIFKGKIDKIRMEEFKYASITRVFDGVLSVFWNCANYFLLFFFLIGFVDEGNDLRSANVFTIIALFGNLTSPIGILPWTFSYVVKMGVSYNRIKRFLNEKEIDQGKVTSFDMAQNGPDSFNPSTLSNGSFLSDSQSQSSSFTGSNFAIKIKSMRFTWSKAVSDPKKAMKKNKKQSRSDEILKEEESKSFERQLLDSDSSDFSSTNGNNKNQETFQLKISDVQIYKGELAVVIGKIGSGKSAFLNAILNELDGSSDNSRESMIFEENGQSMESFDKKIILNGSTAYVSQNHWLQNKTVRDNILFGEEYDKSWYDTVVEAADLKTDFNTFAKGDLKVIGPGGGNLSGGQKQRISICRALYAKKDIYLLDDIFSSLDAHVADKIYQSAILELLIKKLKRTVILVTSHFGIFTDMAKISQIIYFDRGSVVKEQTLIDAFIKYGLSEEQEEEMTKKKQEFDHFIEDIDTEENDNLNGSVGDTLTDVSNGHKDSMGSIFSDGQYQKLDKKEQPLGLVKTKSKEKKKSDENEDNEEEEEQRVKGGIKLETFKIYFESMGWGFLLIFFTANIIMEASQMMIDFWLRDYVNPTSQFFADINEYFGSFKATFIFLIVSNITLTTFRAVFYCICAILSGKRLFDRLNKSLIFSKMKFYDQNPVGRIVNRLSDDVVTIDDFLPWACHVFLENVAYSMGYPLGVIIQFPSLIFLAFIAVILIYFVQKLYRSSNREVRRLNSVNSGKVLSIIGEACKGIIQIRSFNKERFLLKEYLAKLDASINTFLLNQAIEIWMTIRLLLISNIVFGFVAVTSAILVIFDFSFDVSSISMCLTYSMLLSGRFAELMYFFCAVEQNMVSVERIRQYFDNDQEKPDELIFQKQGQDLQVSQKPTAAASAVDIGVNALPSVSIAIEFKNVYITYDNIQDKKLSKDSSDVQFALKDVSIQIKKGEKIAFCGRTGSGKTSILNSLFGMYPIQFGEIFVHGKNIASYSLRQLRDQMSIIPQFGFLYNETLLRNLDPDDQISKQIIQERIHASNLHIRDHHYSQDKSGFSNGLHNKEISITNAAIPASGLVSLEIPHKRNPDTAQDDLSFMIENGGENLSNGEKQIVNFFRVILRDIDIVCLDEASSNMDPKTDAMLHEQIFKFAKDKTLVVITHRLENIDLFDRVVVMDKGQIVECGPVEELRKAKGGFFNKLIKQQKAE